MTSHAKELRKEYVGYQGPFRSGQVSKTGPSTNVSFLELLEYALERSYLTDLLQKETFPKVMVRPSAITWVRVERLPIHPTHSVEWDLLARWQSVLSTLHAWGHRLIYVLLREDGKTRLLLGAVSLSEIIEPREAAAQLCQAAKSQMPGMELRRLSTEELLDECIVPLQRLQAAGAVTGLPSLRSGGLIEAFQT